MDRSFKFLVVGLLAFNSFILFSQKDSAVWFETTSGSTVFAEPTTDPIVSPTPTDPIVVEPTPTTEPISTDSPVVPSLSPTTPSPSVVPSPTPTRTSTISFAPVAYPTPATWTDWLNENIDTINLINDGLQNSDNIGLASYRGWQYGLELTKPLDSTSQSLLVSYMTDIELAFDEWHYHEYDSAIATFNKAIDEWNRFLNYATTA